ncbi:hypothetical protein BEC53_20500 [Escherichia coli]|nr:hypothetical protein [Escherichia coli]
MNSCLIPVLIICSAIIPNKTIIFKMFLPIDNQYTIDSTYHDCENDREKRSKTIFIVLIMTKNMLYPEMSDLFMKGNDSNLLIVFYVQIMPDDFVMQLHRF